MMSKPTLAARLVDALAERFPIEKMNVRSLFQLKEVPVHRMGWAYYLGGLCLLFFGIQTVTGVMLLFYYEPTVSDAWASVDFVTHQVSAGALVRNIHAWTSSCMIFFVLLHLLTTFAMKAFGRPREVTWSAGVLMLLITLSFGFTGYLLPWHQIAVNATKIGLDSVGRVGTLLPGAFADLPRRLEELIQGEATVGQATLSRFDALHVMVLPLLAYSVLAVHLFSVQLHGMSQGVAGPLRRTELFFPFFVLKDFSVWGLAFLVVFVVGLTVPYGSFFAYPLFEPYDSLGPTPDGIKPEWYFFWAYYPLELLPFWVVAAALTAALGLLVLVPLVFRRAGLRSLRLLAAAGATYLVVATVFGQAIYRMLKGGGA
jgi:quinol-cytochrome oxidoreductase complex cytochrome b subunit